MTPFEPHTGRSRARSPRARAGLLAALLVAVASMTLTACGGAAKPLSSVTVTVAQAPPTTPTTTTAPARAAHRHVKAPARVGSGAPGAAGTPAPAPKRVAPKHGASAQTQTIAACLTRAGLVKAGQHSSGLWGGVDPTTRESVLVDGPYKSQGAADTSARSLTGVEIAERGGRYVASATLKSHLATAVHDVAKCLDGAGGGASGAGRSLSF
jgi:hypothetical protein